MENRRKPKLCDNSNCTGCSACYNVCPVDAIEMQPDSIEGFYRPVIDGNKCIRCLKCEKSCPIISPLVSNEESNTIYAVWNTDDKVRELSSSGGVFSALADYILECGGAVIGAAYDENLSLHHILIDRNDGLPKLRASKYIQSEIGSIFRQAVQILQTGRKVLFCGTPCQIAGFKGFLGKKNYDNLVLVDFICHGVPSPKFFHRYIQWLEKRYGHITDFSFRNKNRGWYDAVRCIHMGSEKGFVKGIYDAYCIGFYRSNCLQESCYNCQFLGLKRNSDITISDFWGIGKKLPFGHKEEIKKGVSMVMINSNVGRVTFSKLKDHIEYCERTIGEVIQGNHSLIQSPLRPTSRSTFYIDLDSLYFDTFLKKYLYPDKKTWLVKSFRDNMPLSIIHFFRLRNQK